MNNIELLDKICDALSKLTYKSRGSSIDYEVINKEHMVLVKETILSVLNEYHDKKIGQMEGKLYAYEEIISKSNFAPFLEKKENK